MLFGNPGHDVTAVVLTMGEPTTKNAIDSLSRQIAPVRDVIVVRDTRPFHKALNEGARQVATPFFVQVDADMNLDPHCVATLRGGMKPKIGITVGRLRDAMMEEVVGIKLFRTECFAIAQFRDSISPDTDFVDEIARSGWQTVYVGRRRGLRSSLWKTLGEHRPDYTPAYTYRKYLMEGRRYRHRSSLKGLRWHISRLEQSRHPSAFLAQIAIARGFFRETNTDALGRGHNDDDFAKLDAFLQGNEIKPINEVANLELEQLAPRDRFQLCFRAAHAAFEDSDPGTFRRWMQMLNMQDESSTAWISKLALCQGLLAAAANQSAIESDYQRLSAFTAAADGGRFNQTSAPAAVRDPDDWLDDIKSYASDIGLRRFLVAPAESAEYAAKVPGDRYSYHQTGARVVCAADVNHRLRIKAPFRPLGHMICTDLERLDSLFWCYDLLKAGYVFAHIPTNFGPSSISLPAQFARNAVARFGWRRYVAAFAGMAKSRKPHYQPEPRRVLMLTADLVKGGSERQMVAAVSGLVARGYDVRVLAISRVPPGVPSFEGELSRLGIIPDFVSDSVPSLRRMPGVSRLTDHTALPRWLIERIGSVSESIERHRPAVVHCWLDEPGIFGALAGCSLGTPRILIQQGSTATGKKRRPERAELLCKAYRALVRNPAITILNNSNAGARDYEEWLGIRSGTIGVLHNGFIPSSARMPEPAETAALRASFGLSAEAVVVGTLMRFVWEKDPDLWLDTAAEISRARAHVRFLIGGYGVLEQDMIRRIDVLGLTGQVVLAGSVADAGLFYSAMDVVLLTSAVEGLPNVMIEAQAVGRPVVATDVGGTSEALSEGRTGVIVRPRSAISLAKAVIDVLDNVDWRERVRTEGPDFVSRHFGLERMVDETLRHYGFVGVE